MIPKIKTLIGDMLGYSETEYSKRWISRFTSAILIEILFNLILFPALLFSHLHFGLSFRMCRLFWEKYLAFSTICVSAYAITWVGYMGKAFLAKREEEKIKLQHKLGISYEEIEDPTEEDDYET